MDSPKPILAWMNCYGAWDPSICRPIETMGYDQYLDAFVKALLPFKDRLAGITISGGMKDALGRSECETTGPELERRLAAAGISLSFEIEKDEESLTSMSIAREFARMAAQRSEEITLLLFVDNVRYESNLFTVDHFCKEYGYRVHDVRQLVVALPRLDDHPNSTQEFQQKKLNEMKEEGIEAIERLEQDKRRS